MYTSYKYPASPGAFDDYIHVHPLLQYLAYIIYKSVMSILSEPIILSHSHTSQTHAHTVLRGVNIFVYIYLPIFLDYTNDVICNYAVTPLIWAQVQLALCQELTQGIYKRNCKIYMFSYTGSAGILETLSFRVHSRYIKHLHTSAR